MDFENTLSTAEYLGDTPADDTTQTDTGSPVIIMQSESSAPSATRSTVLDTPSLSDGLPTVVRSVFGEYQVRTQTVTETAADGTSTTSVEPVPGLAGLDWYWLSGVFLFTIVLWSFFRFLGVVFKK